MLAHKQNPCSSTRDALRAARNKVQKTTCRCANDYWLNLYSRIKTATGPTKTAPLKSKTGEVITDQ